MKRASVVAGLVGLVLLAALAVMAYRARCAARMALWSVPFPVELHGTCDPAALDAVEESVGEVRARWSDFTGQPLDFEPRPVHLVTDLPVPEHTWTQTWYRWNKFEACEGVVHFSPSDLTYEVRKAPDYGKLKQFVARELVRRALVSAKGRDLEDWIADAAIRAVLHERPDELEREHLQFFLRNGPYTPRDGVPPGSRYNLCGGVQERNGECRGGNSPWVQPVLEYVRAQRGPAAAREALLAETPGALLRLAAPHGEDELRALDEALDSYRAEVIPPLPVPASSADAGVPRCPRQQQAASAALPNP